MSISNSIKQSIKIHQNYHNDTKVSQRIVFKNNFTYRLLLETIEGIIKKNYLKILDVGCGAGTLSFYLASSGHSVTGIDISQKAINQCRNSVKKIGLPNATFIRASFPQEVQIKEKYDLVIFTEVIEHLPDDQKAIVKIFNLLRKNGLLVLSTPSINAPLHKLGLTQNFDKEVGHLRRYSLPVLRKLLTQNGFKIKETRKTEGIIRNFLFVNPLAGKLVKVVNRFGSDFVTYLDNISLKIFGESNYIIVARKVEKKTTKSTSKEKKKYTKS